jgi:outer membrane protein OmpA-like peptidoglycan-associated protein
MIRLAVPIVILLLMLFGGAVWVFQGSLGTPEKVAAPPAAKAPSAAEDEPSTPAAETSDAKDKSAAVADDGQGSFDVARIDPKGTSVFAGRAHPGANVTIMADGQPIGSTRADENGEWTFSTEHPFASADPKLALKTGPASEPVPPLEPQPQAKVASETQRAEPKPGEEQRTANAVTSNLLKNLEGMVEEARKSEATKAPPPETAAASPPPAAPPAPAASTSAPQQKSEQAAPQAAPKNPEPPLAPQAATPPTAPPSPTPDRAPAKMAAAEPAPTLPAGPPEGSKSVPVPVMFVFNEATFTSDGNKAVALLLEYLQLKHFNKVSLTGHADERGTEEFNMELSKERLDAVAKYLRDNGYKGELDLVPKGKTQPFTGVVRSQFPLEELYQLDRRVELVLAR